MNDKPLHKPQRYFRDKSWIGHSSAILQSLAFAASEIGSVVATVSFKSAQPLLGFPCEASSSIGLIFNEAPLAAAPGDRVEVRYNHEGVFYEFYSSLTAVESPRCWRIRFPNAISYTATRAARRFSVSGDARFFVTLGAGSSRLQIHDLSRTGLALIFPAEEAPQPEAVLAAVLAVPGDQLIPVQLEVRHIRPHPQQDAVIAGCLIKGISPPGRQVMLDILDGLASA